MSNTTDPDESTLDDRREEYERVLSTIRHNTGHPMAPLVARPALGLVLVAHGSLTSDTVRARLRAAREQGDVIVWGHPDGTPRYGLADAAHLDAADEPALTRIIETEVAADQPDKQLIGWCNTHLDAVRDDFADRPHDAAADETTP